MQKKKIQKHLERKFVEEETTALNECPYGPIPNAKLQKDILDAKKGIGVKHAKDAEDLFLQCGIQVKKEQK
jgi:hypothetical protein